MEKCTSDDISSKGGLQPYWYTRCQPRVILNNFHLMQEFNSSSTTTGNNSIAANFTRGITDMYVKEVSGPHGCQDNFDFLKILHLPHKLMQFV